MHCLFVTSLLPEPEPKTGFEIANRAIVAAYREAGARLTLAGFRRPGGATLGADEILLSEMEIENAAVGRAQKGAWVGKAIASGLPVSVAKLRVLTDADLREQLLAAGPFDAVIVNGVHIAGAYPSLLDIAPVIFVAHNVEYLSARQNAAAAGNAGAKALFRREAKLLERIERRVCARARVVHTLALDDAAPLGLAGDRRVVPLSLWIGREPKADDGRRDHDVGLIGTWSWAPNRAGLDWFLKDVVPLLPADISVAIAGSIGGQPPAVRSNVTFAGRVPDAQAFVQASRVMALATTGGTGVQLKTIETLEEGLAAVATPAALRGIGGDLPGNVQRAGDAKPFAHALAELVTAERAGRLPRQDGSAFRNAQREASVTAARKGLDLVGREAAPRTMRIGPLDVLAVSREAAVALCVEALEGPGLTRLAFANAHCVNIAHSDPAYRAAMQTFAILPDGVGLDIAGRLVYGERFPANLNGTDFVPHLLNVIERPLRVALIGGAPGVPQDAADAFSRLAPRHAYLPVSDGFFAPGDEPSVLSALRETQADIVLVAMGVPAQERFIAEKLADGDARLAIGVGALFDFVAGRVPRAPEAWRRARLEWAYRLSREPRRLARRYLLGNPVFIAHALRQRRERNR
ncbi:WecB/TagA/CpsF family glycosyltransferase [Aureimonas mangrovi]|uniref:WecB/TagA/CpsF family glycosyltransferase n=1 Tax=Aureimonas mangrovi TaxID=2758041 RepID=UPI00163D405A|nr:WecB/TagA/CpsF family glycosyltransferase [Aureimonas mangrovi]